MDLDWQPYWADTPELKEFAQWLRAGQYLDAGYIGHHLAQAGLPLVDVYYQSALGSFLVPMDQIDSLPPEVVEWCNEENARVLGLLEYYHAGRGWDLNFCDADDLLLILRIEWLDEPKKLSAQQALQQLGRDNQSGAASNNQQRSRDGVVYVLRADNGLYKIGCAKKFSRRVKRLEISLPYELELIALIPTPDRYGLEHELHARFAVKRLGPPRAEWFALDGEDISYLKQLAEVAEDV